MALLLKTRERYNKIAGVSVPTRTTSISILTVRLSWTLVLIFNVAYVAVLVQLSPLALQDFPAQLARAHVLADLIYGRGAHFGGLFQYHFLFIPYALGDLALATLTAILGATTAAALWGVLAFLSLPCALLFYLRTSPIGEEARALLLVLSLYLATDWFFLMGFLEFRLGIALVLVTLTLAERVRCKPTGARVALYTGTLALGYLTHLTVLVFVAMQLAVIAAFRHYRRTTTLWVEAALLLPCVMLLTWHLGFAGMYRMPEDQIESVYVLGGLSAKLWGLDDEFLRFERVPDWLMMGVLGCCLCLQVGRLRRRDLEDPAVHELLILAAAMTGLYFILPRSYQEAYFVDVRALPFAALFLILASLRLGATTPGSPGGWPLPALGLAALLALGNLAYLVEHLKADSQWLVQYRAVVAAVPRGSRLLPVYTLGSDGRVMSLLHAFTFLTVDRDGFVPYLQSGDTGDPQKYFRYLHRPYAPSWIWYGNTRVGAVDWQSVACEYQFLLVTKPFDPTRLPPTAQMVVENDSATLFSLQPDKQRQKQENVVLDSAATLAYAAETAADFASRCERSFSYRSTWVNPRSYFSMSCDPPGAGTKSSICGSSQRRVSARPRLGHFFQGQVNQTP